MEVSVIKIDIGVFPQSYASDKPESGGFFPFAIDGKVPYLYEISFWERKDEQEVEEFVSKWMNSLNEFPIIAFFESFDFQQKEIEDECLSNSIEYTKFKWRDIDFYIKVTVRDIEQFKVIFPYLYANGSMNNFACLSLEKDIFSVGNRLIKNIWGKSEKVETPIVTAKENVTVLWVDYDGDGMIFISNEIKYSQLTSIIKTLPKDTVYSIIEYEE